jgi:hypothetical protein
VFLTGGGKIVGEVVEQRADAIVVDVGAGRVTLPAARVVRVASGQSALSQYRERAARLSPRDTAGWLALGFWARDNDLSTLAREAFERALASDPGSDAAHRALGHVQLGGQWMTEAESYRARGFVQYEGVWMTPDEAQMQAAQRAAETEARLVQREAAAREREAEARARAAEAEAARAEAEAQAASSAYGGIPYGWVWGPGYGPYGPYVYGDGYIGGRPRVDHRGGGVRRGHGHGGSVVKTPPPQRDRGAQPAPPPKPSRPAQPSNGNDRAVRRPRG